MEESDGEEGDGEEGDEEEGDGEEGGRDAHLIGGQPERNVIIDSFIDPRPSTSSQGGRDRKGRLWLSGSKGR